MSLKDKEKWNSKYGGSECLAGRQPSSWLADNRSKLPGKGRALDLAMGEGRNALFAASLGSLRSLQIRPCGVFLISS